MRHASTGDHRDSFIARGNHFGDSLAKLLTTPGGGQRWKIGIHKNRHDGKRTSTDYPFVNSGKRVAQDGILRIRQIKAVVHQLVEQILGQALMDGEIVVAACKLGNRPFTGKNGKRRNGGQKKCLQMVVANDDDSIGLALCEILTQLAHRGNIRVQLRGIFTGWPHEELRRVYGRHGSYDFSHFWLPHLSHRLMLNTLRINDLGLARTRSERRRA